MKKLFFDFNYDSKIRILPSINSPGKSYNHIYWFSEEDIKKDFRKRKIKNILNAIDL